jgi:hypothetical protein
MNVDQLEDYFENVDLAQMQPGGANYFTAEEVKFDPGAVLQKICNVYHIIRPFLEWAEKFFLIPKKVRAVIGSFTTLMDTVCP